MTETLTTDTPKVKVIEYKAGPLAQYQLREGVTEVIAFWDDKVPFAHNADGSCKGRFGDNEMVCKPLAEIVGKFSENASLELAGQPRTMGFCTRCLITMKAEFKPQRVSPTGDPMVHVTGDEAAALPSPAKSVSVHQSRKSRTRKAVAAAAS